MDFSRISFGEMVAGISGLVLLISLWLPWYGVSASAGGFSASATADAWEALSLIDIILFLVSVLVVGLVAAKAAGSALELPAPSGQVIAAAGGLALILVLFRIIDIPDSGIGDIPGIDVGRRIGVFLALIASGAIAYGGYNAMNESTGSRRPVA